MEVIWTDLNAADFTEYIQQKDIMLFQDHLKYKDCQIIAYLRLIMNKFSSETSSVAL